MKTVSKAVLGVTGSTARKYMQPGEQDILLALVRRVRPKVMIEIGVNEGLTAKAVLENIRTIERYIGIDVDEAYKFEIPTQQSERPNEPGILVRDDPRFELRLRGAPLPTSCDVAFIDGDHGKRAVWKDSIWAAKVVRPGGLIIFHDYGNPTVEVTDVLNALYEAGRDICHVENTWLAFEWR